tara:strand:+ start:772 stop:1638 length:867 start_codon:yes stop_codon:yes gene_type:complete
MKKSKIIWRLTDGKIGHEKQSLALVESIKSQTKCKVINVNIQNLPNPLLSIIFKKYNFGGSFIKPDIAIGAGHKTHLHLLSIKRNFGAKVVVIMKPSIPTKFFDLCLITKHQGMKNKANIFTTQTPLINFNTSMKKKENVGLFLVGGNSKHYKWDTKLVQQQIKEISDKFKFRKLLLTTSRRTPCDFVSELKKLKIDNIKIYEYGKIKNNWLDKQIIKVRNIWVTNDSYSMIIEALASGAQTDILELKNKSNSKLSKEINKIKLNLSKKISIQNESKRAAMHIKKIWF